MVRLSHEDRRNVQELQAELGAGDAVTTARWHELDQAQRRLAIALDVAHRPANLLESFALIRDSYDSQPLVGPRWWFHLIGLRHGAAHVLLTTPQGWFVAQRRARDKDDAPGALDVSVSGHTGVDDAHEAAWREMSEELGLSRARPDSVDEPDISGNALTFLWTYDAEDVARANENPPFVNRERRWVYSAALTARGLGRMRFADSEVTSLVLLGAADLQALARRCIAREVSTAGEFDLAPGIMDTLPRWLGRA
jgi:8-oxo-dGTP pyrophosphatase MutT (NUDIX family)